MSVPGNTLWQNIRVSAMSVALTVLSVEAFSQPAELAVAKPAALQTITVRGPISVSVTEGPENFIEPAALKIESKPVETITPTVKSPKLPIVKSAALSRPSLPSKAKPIPVPAIPRMHKRQNEKLSVRPSLKGTMEISFDDEDKIKAWASVKHKVSADLIFLRRCMEQYDCSDPMIRQWADFLRPLKSSSRTEQMVRVNNFANARQYIKDRANYGLSDYWARPVDFLRSSGDCEDYAIFKYASLKALGFSDQDMRLVVGILDDGTPHAVLQVSAPTGSLILDNRFTRLIPEHQSNLIPNPKYSVNLTRRWTHFIPRRSGGAQK